RVDGPRALAGLLLTLEDVVGVEVGDTTLVVRAKNPQRFFRELTRLVLEEDYAVERLEPLDDSAHAILGYLLGSGRRGRKGFSKPASPPCESVARGLEKRQAAKLQSPLRAWLALVAVSLQRQARMRQMVWIAL